MPWDDESKTPQERYDALKERLEEIETLQGKIDTKKTSVDTKEQEFNEVSLNS